ncbi:MAG: archaeal heat shock protein Hsp20 [Promethearchaeota archaeon]
MAEEDDRRKRKRWWDDESTDAQFEALQRMFEEIMKMFSDVNPEDMFGPDAQHQLEEIMKQLEKNPMVWGFSAGIGPDGKMRLNPFGNLKPEGAPPTVRSEREPLIDVMEQEDKVIIIAELPGVKKEEININVTDYAVTLKVESKDRKYAKNIDLPSPVDINHVTSSYNNGILEIQLHKR